MTAGSAQGIVIVGGGLAAVRTVQALRALGYSGPLQMFSEEAYPPYDRPPLSKDCLTSEVDVEAIRLLSVSVLEGLDVDIRLNARAVELDTEARTVAFDDGSRVAYARLVVATGARARHLAGLEPSPRIHYLRSVDDARALARALARAQRLIVVGSGFIGLEVASSARTLGLDVEVLAADDGPMIGVVGKQLSDWLVQLHAAHGVRISSAVTVSQVEDTGSAVELCTSDRRRHLADVVVVGAGVSRELDWLAAAGLRVDSGLGCDDDGRTDDPDVFAAGDIVGGIAHWTAAADSARRVAHAVMDLDQPADPGDGFFWTEQHGHRLQFVGSAAVDSELDVPSGALESGRFVAGLRTGGAITGVFASNSPRDFLKRRLAFNDRRSDGCR
jgi:3-phenylpropionate/trans-cinnamate dioxygenase ferredoxin reductase subunit